MNQNTRRGFLKTLAGLFAAPFVAKPKTPMMRFRGPRFYGHGTTTLNPGTGPLRLKVWRGPGRHGYIAAKDMEQVRPFLVRIKRRRMA